MVLRREKHTDWLSNIKWRALKTHICITLAVFIGCHINYSTSRELSTVAWHQCQCGTKNDKLSVHALGLDKRDVIGLDIKLGTQIIFHLPPSCWLFI